MEIGPSFSKETNKNNNESLHGRETQAINIYKKKFTPSFTEFKQGDWLINEASTLEWMDEKINIKEVHTSNDEQPKIAKIRDY